MESYLQKIEEAFIVNANDEIASGQKAYLRDKYEFYGIKTPKRREIQKPFLEKKNLPEKTDLDQIVKTLWNKPQREWHHFAMELAYAYRRKCEVNDIAIYEYMITHKSWWDTVDFIASKLVGNYFKYHPEQIEKCVDKWLKSGNMWLQRTAILFQLAYKEKTDTALLSRIIESLLGSDEFFINKAIGWVLRQYGRVNPEWVLAYVGKTKLDKLSEKEALKHF